MNSFKTNKKIWSDIYKAGKSNLSYPNENMVRYINHLYGGIDVTKLKLLDYGFGSGNNLKHLCEFGFDVYGVEVSEDAKKMTLAKMKEDFDESRLFLIDKDNILLPYENESFDVIVAWQVLYYNSFDGLMSVLNTLYNLLKPGGRLITTMARTQDVLAVNSEMVSVYERRVNNTVSTQVGSIILAIPSEKELNSIFSQFENISTGYFESNLFNITGSHWIIYGEKQKE